MPQIIIRYCGNSRHPVFSANGNGDYLQIAVTDLGTGKAVVIFTGEKFTAEEYEKQGGQKQEEFFMKSFHVK